MGFGIACKPVGLPFFMSFLICLWNYCVIPLDVAGKKGILNRLCFEIGNCDRKLTDYVTRINRFCTIDSDILSIERRNDRHEQTGIPRFQKLSDRIPDPGKVWSEPWIWTPMSCWPSRVRQLIDGFARG